MCIFFVLPAAVVRRPTSYRHPGATVGWDLDYRGENRCYRLRAELTGAGGDLSIKRAEWVYAQGQRCNGQQQVSDMLYGNSTV